MASKSDLDDLKDFALPTKKKRKTVVERFRKPVTDQEMSTLSKGYVPANTKKNNGWAVRVFNEWRAQRNQSIQEEKCPSDLLEKPNVSKLNYWLARFVAEVRRQDGNPYPPQTIHQLLAALQRVVLEKDPTIPKICNRKETAFVGLTSTCNSVYRQLHSKGVGTKVTHTRTFSAEKENLLWTSGVLGCDMPKNLQRTVFLCQEKILHKGW